MKIGIYGGTFNPPHLGHMAAARFAMEALSLDKLIFVPAALPPHKPLADGTPPAEQRLAMVEIAADNLLLPDKVGVSDIEISRPGKSYTAETLKELHQRHPDDELWLLMGTDMFLTVQNWYQPEAILSLAGVAAFSRTEQDSAEMLNIQADYLRKTFGARVYTVTLPQITQVSSTELREHMGEEAYRKYLCPAVYGYILMHGLYGSHADLRHLSDQDLRCCSYSMMRAKRIRHVMGCEEEAERLALRWGADPVKARRAGILHDCTKYLEMEDQRAICDKYGVELDELEQRAVKLLHSKTGACIARNVFGEDDEVYDAIFSHTTGKADMTLLEKILYIADYMEPNRDFPGVERLRELAYEDLDAAVLAGCEMSIQEMADRGLPVHRNTVAARDWLLAHQKG